MKDVHQPAPTGPHDARGPSPRLVLFDLDDTLCDYAGARAGRLRAAFSRALADRSGAHGEVDVDALIAESIAIHPHASDHFGMLLGRYGVTDAEVIQSTRTWYHQNRFLGLALFTDATRLLRAIRSGDPDRRIGLITNGPADVQRDKIALLELETSVDFAIISGEFGVAKPDPAIFHEALRLGDAAAAETLVIGDSPEFDIAGARAAGIPALWMNHAGVPWPGAAPHPDEVQTFAEIARRLGIAFDPLDKGEGAIDER